MRAFLILFYLTLICTYSYSQYREEYGVSIGSSNYLGDIGGSREGNQNSPVDMKIKAQRFSANLYYRRKLNKDMSLRVLGVYSRLYGNDAMTLDSNRQARNLSFKTDVIELAITGEWNFIQSTRMVGSVLDSARKVWRKDLRGFFFVGMGVIYFDPKAELLGKTYRLRPLMTEGVKYSPFSWTIPFGVGFSYTLNKQLRFGFDANYRITGTDFLDDVSGSYSVSYEEGASGWAKVNQGSTDKKDIRDALGNRTHEVQSKWNTDKNYNPKLPIGANYDHTANGGTPRGGAWTPGSRTPQKAWTSIRDGYVTLNASVGFVLKGKNKYYRDRKKYITKRRSIINQRGGRF